MHADVVTVSFRPVKVEKGVRIYRDLVMPESKEMRGFEGGYMLTDAEPGKGYIIGLWETREAAEGFEGGAFKEQAAKCEDVRVEPPSRGFTKSASGQKHVPRPRSSVS